LEKVRRRHGYWAADFYSNDDDDDDDLVPDDPTSATSHELKMLENMMARQQPTISSAKAQDLPPNPPDGVAISVPCDPLRGIIIAGDILYRRTNKKRYNRSIYLITDGSSPVTDGADPSELGHVLAGLSTLNVKLQVVGVGFNEADEGEEEEDEEDEDDEDDDDSSISSHEVLMSIKRENTKMFKSIAAQMGGSVTAASDLLSMMKIAAAKKIPKSAKKKFQLVIAPTITVSAEYALMVSKSNMSTLRQHVILTNPDGSLSTSDVMRDMSYRDSSNPDVEVEHDMRARAYRYGSDYIPTNAYDEEALKMKSPISISVMGFVQRSSIPIAAMIDAGYAVSGGESLRSRTAISALAQAMDGLEQVAIARFVKTTDADPLIGILLPMEENGEAPHKLVWIQMPFEEDFAKFTFLPFKDGEITAAMRKAADDVVDSMMLQDEVMVKVPNPGIRSLNRTLVKRLVKGPERSGERSEGRDVVDCRVNGDVVIEVPPEIMAKAGEALNKFQDVCPVKEVSKEKTFATKRYWSEGVAAAEGEEGGGGGKRSNNGVR
jgi:ATP-dependent DNA helicase 2 subunit 2